MATEQSNKVIFSETALKMVERNPLSAGIVGMVMYHDPQAVDRARAELRYRCSAAGLTDFIKQLHGEGSGDGGVGKALIAHGNAIEELEALLAELEQNLAEHRRHYPLT